VGAYFGANVSVGLRLEVYNMQRAVLQ